MSQTIQTLEQLEDIIESELITPELRGLAELLITSMNDWPTQNLESIKQFIDELSSYFGRPITKKRLNSVSFSGTNSWELESKASLEELLSTASAIFGTNTIEGMVEQLLAKLATLEKHTS
ncbi:hypothetical protein [Reichenbachiella ulvae]|uniref:Uncharacterized protein n=1 Tax=Reichenbachiella ulvae TaxID=2980104 RepID=A0ABT3CNN2_9BACT|nr:hypothetical protein [Reichenbachiella ulvae]MCV9385355.1 hypothetical protein [Reichenbachiella ulvae]